MKRRNLFIVVLLIAALIVLITLAPISRPAKGSLSVKGESQFRIPLNQAAEEFEKEEKSTVRFHFQTASPKDDLWILSEKELASAKEAKSIREVIPVAEKDGVKIFAAVTAGCEKPAAALRFARYLAAPEKGNRIFRDAGFTEIPGDVWASKPELILFSGGVNRPAVEKLLADFSDREGVTLSTVFNGCGILCASMKTMEAADSMAGEKVTHFPDAYYACDLCFVPPVAEHFNEVVLLTETDIGIVVPKANPHNIRTLTDLAKPGLKVGLSNQKQSTLGYMTQGILRSSGLEKAIRKNAVSEVPTADFLITQLRSDSLDAAIVYRVNAELQKEHLEFIPIKHQGAKAVQPFSVRHDSKKRQLAQRLQDHFLAHPEAFEEKGFVWRGDEGVMKTKDIEIPEWLRAKVED